MGGVSSIIPWSQMQGTRGTLIFREMGEKQPQILRLRLAQNARQSTLEMTVKNLKADQLCAPDE